MTMGNDYLYFHKDERTDNYHEYAVSLSCAEHFNLSQLIVFVPFRATRRVNIGFMFIN